MKLPKIIVIVGPTCSGKTDLSVEIAKEIKSEIISADSLQVYREFSICTSKPTSRQLDMVKHHLIGHVSVTEEYSVCRFLKDAKEKIKEISAKSMVPIIVGGTGLYIDALIKNFQFEELKCENKVKIDDKDLYDKLKKIDPASAKIIDRNDCKRLSRAIDFFNKFGFSIIEQKRRTLESECEYEVLKVGLNFKDRNKLYEKINLRVDKMLKEGLLKEIDEVRKLKVSKTASAAIGYKELIPYFENKVTLKEAIDKIKQETRRYSKRQITWFKRCEITSWFFLDEIQNVDLVKSLVIKKICDVGFDVQNKIV